MKITATKPDGTIVTIEGDDAETIEAMRKAMEQPKVTIQWPAPVVTSDRDLASELRGSVRAAIDKPKT